MTDAAHAAAVAGGGGVRTLTAAAVARAVNGRLVGSASVEISAIAPLDRAGPNDLSFLASIRYAPLFARSMAGVVLVTPELERAHGAAAARVVVAKPHEALLALLPQLYVAPQRRPGVHDTARIGRGARLAPDVTIGPCVVVGEGASIGEGTWLESHVVVGPGVEIGPHCRLHPGVVLYAGAHLGARVQLHAGVRIGSDGFGYVFRDGAHHKIPHVGRCVIGDDVEIGANSTIDRGSIDDTVIGAGTKIDNLVHVGHNVRVGRLCLLMAQVGIAGSAHVGDGVIVAGQAGIGGHVEIGDRARIGGQAGVFGDVPEGETWSGYPARPHRESLRAHAAMFKIAGLLKRLERLVDGDPG